MERDDRADCIRALQAGLGAGLTHIDTAELYGSGKVEEIVGEAIRGRRQGVYLVSKVLPSNASRTGTVQACERSLKRLGTDSLDLYLLHWPGSYPLEETIGAFEGLKKQGKIAAWGVSNFDVEGMQETLSIAGPGKMICNQVLYHLEERAIEHHVIPWCAEHHVAVVAYSPFGSGRFPKASSPGGKVLAQIAARHKASSYQAALAYLVREKHVFTIPKSSSEAHVLDNAKAGDLILTADDLGELGQAFPQGKPRRGVPTL